MQNSQNSQSSSSPVNKPRMIPLVFYLNEEKDEEEEPPHRRREMMENLPPNAMFFKPQINVIIDCLPPPSYECADLDEDK
ncbi:hypothetical protein RUM44_003171 [Polyplax serrata]|uniref:Uncharacterized protein n=1 Tax=Polyplax serrata TaxID=468196 RepID=A0ABR1AZ91_POLSC